jgi:hypothetical protein
VNLNRRNVFWIIAAVITLTSGLYFLFEMMPHTAASENVSTASHRHTAARSRTPEGPDASVDRSASAPIARSIRESSVAWKDAAAHSFRDIYYGGANSNVETARAAAIQTYLFCRVHVAAIPAEPYSIPGYVRTPVNMQLREGLKKDTTHRCQEIDGDASPAGMHGRREKLSSLETAQISLEAGNPLRKNIDEAVAKGDLDSVRYVVAYTATQFVPEDVEPTGSNFGIYKLAIANLAMCAIAPETCEPQGFIWMENCFDFGACDINKSVSGQYAEMLSALDGGRASAAVESAAIRLAGKIVR